jgi:primosomal protein N' (replication factor Y)
LTSLFPDSLQTVQVAVPGPFQGPLSYLSKTVIPIGCRVEVPLGNRTVVGIVVDHENPDDIDPKKLKPVSRQLDERPLLSIDILSIAQWMSRYYLHEFSSAYLLALPALLRKGEVPAASVETRVKLTLEGKAIDPAQLKRSPKQQALLDILQRADQLSMEQIRQLGFTSAHLKSLETKRLCEREEVEQLGEIKPTGDKLETSLTLNSEQQAALDRLTQDIFTPFLLEGVTGSGKTEVYLQAIEACLRKGKRALVLVPEIGLTPQTIQRFQRRFKDPLVALHSGMTDKQRQQAWYQASLGQASVVIGTRSAVLTPIPDLGLIVIDEEHDVSFKQQDTLRYQARDVALKRAQQANIPIVLGSATPSLETLHNALIGRFGHLLLPNRAAGAQMPLVETVDMRKQQNRNGLSERLLLRTHDHLRDGNQALLFLNRRGFAPSWFCDQCGWIADCVYCDANLTHHRHSNTNICHHCGHREKPAHSCPSCGHSPLQAMGTGTERAEELLADLFPDIPVIRFDRDAASTRKKFEAQLEKTQADGPAIIVGTQMLAKGHHFERVTLVGIWDIDTGLFSADLRAKERMGQLLTQVSGRSGRGERRGEVLIQTYYPENPIFTPLLNHDYRTFAVKLLDERKKAGLPPFGFVAVIRSDSAFADRAENLLRSMASYLLSLKTVRVLGPIPALLSRRAGKNRYMLIVQAEKRSALHEAVVPLHSHYPRQEKQVSWHIDIDPAELS